MFRTVARVALAKRGYAIPVETVCREWRCKVDGEETAEKVEAILAQMQGDIPDGANIQRLVCKAAWDYKVQTSMPLDKWASWKEAEFSPENAFLDKLRSTDGVTNVDAQAYVFDNKN